MISIYQDFDLMYFDRKELEWLPDEYFDQILFIGFGYDKDNISKLCLNKISSSMMNGTGYGLSCEKIAELIKVPGIKIKSKLTCTEFIESQKF